MKWWLFLVALPMSAHVMSISNGEATVDGKRLDYILRIPFYEVERLPHPEITLLSHIQFQGGNLQNHKCFRDGDSLVCAADYLFAQPVKTLDVTCTLYEVTAANHVHVLRAVNEGKEDRAFFDYTFTNAKLTFQPPTPMSIALQRLTDGAMRGVAGALQLLFLLTLALAARSGRELIALIAAFLAGLIGGAFLNWHPAPKFAECAAALGIAYLAVEILFVPTGGMRWLIASVLGVFQGVYLALFLTVSGTVPYVAGAVLASALVSGMSGSAMLCWVPRRVTRWVAALPLVMGLFWFFARVWA